MPAYKTRTHANTLVFLFESVRTSQHTEHTEFVPLLTTQLSAENPVWWYLGERGCTFMHILQLMWYVCMDPG